MNLTQKTAKGVIWAGSSSAFSTILNFVILAVLARLLFPSDFGLMGMIVPVTGFVILIADLGLGVAIIQNQDITDEQLSTFFFLNIILGIALCCVVYFSSGLVALFFKESELISLLKIMSFSFIIMSLGQTFRTLLQKWMDFKTLFKVEVSGIIIYGICSITFAIKGFGVWSLVYGFLIRQVGETVLLWIVTPFRPQLVFSLQKIKNLMNFGIYVFGERIINYFKRNLGHIIIGRFLGAQVLGYYVLAYQLMLFPVSKISGVVTKVTFPAFSVVQNDNKKIRDGYLKVVKYISLVTFPMMAGLFAVAPELITMIYGAKWRSTILVLQILCVVGALQSIGTTVGTVLYAKGRPDIGFKWNCIAICCYALAFLFGIRWGIVGVSVAYAIASLILFPIIQSITNGLINLRWKQFSKQFVNQTIGAIAIIIAVLGLKMFLLSRLVFSQVFILISLIFVGIIIYVVVTLSKERKLITEGVKILGILK